MSSEPRDLRSLQAWMQEVITHPQGTLAGIRTSAAQQHVAADPDELQHVVTRSAALTAQQRLDVYNNAYFGRLLECMQQMFPVLVKALDPEVFDAFAFGYLQAYPSRSYTLNRLAERFVDYLVATRPAPDDSSDQQPQAPAKPGWTDLVIDLARLELTIDEVFDGPGIERSETLTQDELRRIDPDDLPGAQLTTAPCLRLLQFGYPTNDFYTAVRADEKPRFPEPRPTYLAVTRLNYVVRRLPLESAQFHLLQELQAGSTLGTAVAAAAEQTANFQSLPASLGEWFQQWAEARFFISIKLAAD